MGAKKSVREFRGSFDCILKSFRSEGISGVFSGFGVSLLGAIIFKALFIGGYDIAKYAFDIEEAGIMKKYLAAQVFILMFYRYRSRYIGKSGI
jgi:solute carrier family 25 (adenine nucleotide translocator) protein 4/5/6/31